MIYVDSGFKQSGTSMMMPLLQEIGIGLYYNRKREDFMCPATPDTENTRTEMSEKWKDAQLKVQNLSIICNSAGSFLLNKN
jgi:hypothetical protein